MEKEYVVKLDVYLGVLEARVISFNQLNTGTCKLSFELTSNKQALDLTGKKVTFEVTTPSGATLEDAILVTDATQGKCECTLANDMIAEQGMHYAEINVYSKDNTKLFTFNKFRYIVNGQLGAKDITVDTRYSTLQELIFDVENLKNQSVIDTEAVAQMKNETDLMHKEVIVKHGDVEGKHQEVVTLSQSVKDDASRTASNAQQVSTDKGIVTKAKNEVVAKHDEVLKTAGVIAQDKAIVEQAKDETLGYKNYVETMKNDVQQLVTDSTEDLILEGNRQVARVSTEGTTQVDLAKAEVTKATQQAIKATEQAGIAQSHAETAQGELSKVAAEGVKQIKAVSDKGVEQVQVVATEGAKQIELAKTEVIKAEEAATLATTEADRAGAQAQEKVNSKIGHNGVFDDTIFNFIGDENSTISALQIGEKTYSFNGGSSSGDGNTTDNVVDRAGRTQEQINRTFYKRMCKEIPSPSGEPITVKNGEEGYVLSAEIKGNTQLFKRAKGSQDEWIVIPNDEGRDTVAFEYKLDSTQAIISNNGEPYPIYANEEDKANKKVISLPFAEDKVTLNEDGSATWVNASENKKIAKITRILSVGDVNVGVELYVPNGIVNNTKKGLFCDKINAYSYDGLCKLAGSKNPWQQQESTIPVTGVSCGSGNYLLGIFEVSKFGNTVESINTKLAEMQDINCIISKTPTAINIPKELVSTILTNKTNIWEVGGAVRASSYKITQPVDAVGEIRAELEEIKKQLGAVAALQLGQIN